MTINQLIDALEITPGETSRQARNLILTLLEEVESMRREIEGGGAND